MSTDQVQVVQANDPAEFIGTIDVWDLHNFPWPFMRTLCRRYVDRHELRAYERQLLASQRWARVRCVPHGGAGAPDANHVFDIYGVAR